MNPLTNVKNIQKLNQIELEKGLFGKKSWHDDYRDSAWVFVGGLPYDLTEGDVLCVFSQYGEIVNMNFIRDKETGKPKGYCFICFEDQRSTVLTVDNINGSKIMGRVIRVDHVANYRMPKEHEDEDDQTRRIRMEGCAPQAREEESEQEEDVMPLKKAKKEKKSHKKKKDKKKLKVKKQSSSDDDSSEDARKMSRKGGKRKKQSLSESVSIKKEQHDTGYNKYAASDSNMMDRDIERKYKTYQESAPGRENKGLYSREREVQDRSDDYGRRRKQPGEVEISLKVSYREKDSPQQGRGYGQRQDREYLDEDVRINRRREFGSENVVEPRAYQDVDRYEKRKSWTNEDKSDRFRDSKDTGNNYRDTDRYAEPSRDDYRTERPRDSETRYEYSKRRSDFDDYRESERGGGDRKSDNYRESDQQRDREDYFDREKSSYNKRNRTM